MCWINLAFIGSTPHCYFLRYFWRFSLAFLPYMFFMCEIFFKHVVDNNRVQQYRYKSDNLNRRQNSRTWQHNIKMADNAGQFIKTFSLFYSSNKNILRLIYEFLIIKKKTWIGDHISIMFRFLLKQWLWGLCDTCTF